MLSLSSEGFLDTGRVKFHGHGPEIEFGTARGEPMKARHGPTTYVPAIGKPSGRILILYTLGPSLRYRLS